MTKFRDELQALETQVVSKGVTLTTEEATAFWPVFKRFQAEQRKIIDGQIAAVRQYADHYAALSDADSIAYVNALLSRDQQIQRAAGEVPGRVLEGDRQEQGGARDPHQPQARPGQPGEARRGDPGRPLTGSMS